MNVLGDMVVVFVFKCVNVLKLLFLFMLNVLFKFVNMRFDVVFFNRY